MIHHYRKMVDDPLRIEAFDRAIRAVVRPGDVVVDAGCGLATYAVLACRAGAARVYAVDESAILEAARDVVRHNGCADRVTLLAGHTTDLEPPERAAVVLFEDYRAGFYAPRTLAAVRDLATRWLAPGGCLVPDRVRVFVAVVQDAGAALELDGLRARGERVAGVDLSPTRARAFSTPLPRRLPASALLTAPHPVAELDLAAVPSDAALRCEVELDGLRDGTAHGLLVWFDLVLAGEVLGTGPASAPSAWSQSLLPFDPPLPVARGERVQVGLEAAPFGDEAVWRWRAATPTGQVRGDSFAGLLVGRDALVGRDR